MPFCALTMRATEPLGSTRLRMSSTRKNVGVWKAFSLRNWTASFWRARVTGVKRTPCWLPYFSWESAPPTMLTTWASSVRH